MTYFPGYISTIVHCACSGMMVCISLQTIADVFARLRASVLGGIH